MDMKSLLSWWLFDDSWARKFGRCKWIHDTLAAAMFTEESEIRERYPFRGDFLMYAPKFAPLACLV